MNFWYPLNGAERVLPEKVDKLIPLYPFKIMKRGDWFFVPFSERHPETVRASASSASKRFGMQYSVKRIVDGVIVTRVS